MEILTRFTTAVGQRISYDDVSDILIPEYRWLNFVRQLYTVRIWHDWCVQHQICIALNLDSETAGYLLKDRSVQAVIGTMPFIRLEIHENFSSSELGSPGLLHQLRAHAPLWLDDVGSGSRNNFSLLLKGYFSTAKIDKAFFWQNHADDPARLNKVIRDLARFAGQVVVEGVENSAHLRSLVDSPGCWLQGYHFRSVCLKNLDDIPLQLTSGELIPFPERAAVSATGYRRNICQKTG